VLRTSVLPTIARACMSAPRYGRPVRVHVANYGLTVLLVLSLGRTAWVERRGGVDYSRALGQELFG
jgi:hypothetical protein